MLTILIAAVVIVGVALIAVCASGKEPATVVEHHHLHYHGDINPQVYLVQVQILIAERKKATEPVGLPVARLLNPSKAIDRYRSHERKPS